MSHEGIDFESNFEWKHEPAPAERGEGLKFDETMLRMLLAEFGIYYRDVRCGRWYPTKRNLAARKELVRIIDEAVPRFRALLASHPQPEAATDARELAWKAVTGLYYCGRVWSAWQVGTMSEDDFTPAEDVDEVVDEVAAEIESSFQARLASAREQGGMTCPSCGCVVDKAGRGHHSAADCVFLKLAEEAERELAEVRADAQRQISETKVKVEEMRAALKAMVTAFDPYGTGGDAYHNHAETITMARAALATPAEGTTREGERGPYPKCTKPGMTKDDCHALNGEYCMDGIQCRATLITPEPQYFAPSTIGPDGVEQIGPAIATPAKGTTREGEPEPGDVVMWRGAGPDYDDVAWALSFYERDRVYSRGNPYHIFVVMKAAEVTRLRALAHESTGDSK
jgi:hypothetical protein